jgi:two-component system chemotaxis response regulator CheY
MSYSILVVSESKFARTSINNVVSLDDRYIITGEAEKENEVLKKIKKLTPDIIIIDISMLSINVIHISKIIKNYNKNIKIIIISDTGLKSLVIEAYKVGVCGFIIKPFQPEKLIKTLDKCME